MTTRIKMNRSTSFTIKSKNTGTVRRKLLLLSQKTKGNGNTTHSLCSQWKTQYVNMNSSSH